MTPTSEDRIEVAERLRENASKRGVTLDYLGSTQVASWWLLLHTIGCNSNEQEVAFNMLADLIDRPICHMCDTDHEFEDSVRCDRCRMTFMRPWEPFKYCPNCGARVV